MVIGDAVIYAAGSLGLLRGFRAFLTASDDVQGFNVDGRAEARFNLRV